MFLQKLNLGYWIFQETHFIAWGRIIWFLLDLLYKSHFQYMHINEIVVIYDVFLNQMNFIDHGHGWEMIVIITTFNYFFFMAETELEKFVKGGRQK